VVLIARIALEFKTLKTYAIETDEHAALRELLRHRRGRVVEAADMTDGHVLRVGAGGLEHVELTQRRVQVVRDLIGRLRRNLRR
jgi:hypothetical protein